MTEQIVNLPGYGEVKICRQFNTTLIYHIITIWQMHEEKHHKILAEVTKEVSFRQAGAYWDYAKIGLRSYDSLTVESLNLYMPVIELAKAQAELLDNEFPAGTKVQP